MPRVIELLPSIKVPSLVVVGADDAPFLAASDYMAAKIPGAQKVVIPAAGHAVNIDQPQAFIEAVLPFLDGLPRSAIPKKAGSVMTSRPEQASVSATGCVWLSTARRPNPFRAGDWPERPVHDNCNSQPMDDPWDKISS